MRSRPTWFWSRLRLRSGARPRGPSGWCCRLARSSRPWWRRRSLPWSECCWWAGCASECRGLACGSGREDRRRRLLDEPVDQPVGDRFFRAQEVVAIGVSLDSLERLTCVLGDQLVQDALDADDLASVDIEVTRLPLKSPAADERLVHVDG